MHNLLLSAVVFCLSAVGATPWSGIVICSNPSTQTFNPFVEPNGKIQSWNISNDAIRPAAVNYGGKIYSMGGLVSHGHGYHPVDTVTIFDPITNTTSEGPSLPEANSGSSAVTMSESNSVIMCGGNNGSNDTDNCYQLTGNKWMEIAPLPEPRSSGAMIKLNKQAYYFGGENDDIVMDTVYVHDRAFSWSSVAPMPNATGGFGIVALNETSAMMCGGYQQPFQDDKEFTNDCFIYSAVDNTWTPTHPLVNLRRSHSLVYFSGRIFCLGGDTSIWGADKTVEVYNEVTGWHQLDDELAANTPYHSPAVVVGE